KKAEDANRRALQIEPTQQVALNNLGVALQGQRRTKEALEIYQRASQLNPNDPIAKGNIVRLVRPVSGLGVVLDVVRMVAIPWTIPIILIRLTVQFIASARRRSQPRAGAQLYYDREWLGSRWQLWRVLVAALVFAFGYAALGILQLRGWSLVSTGIPVLVLLLVCIGIAFSAILGRLPAEIGRRWRALRPSGHDKCAEPGQCGGCVCLDRDMLDDVYSFKLHALVALAETNRLLIVELWRKGPPPGGEVAA